MLKDLAEIHELPALVLRYRELAKIKSTYIDALPRMRAGDGRVHSSFNETVTTTGAPVLIRSQPAEHPRAHASSGAISASASSRSSSGCKFLSADYSQIELRLLAHLSGDEALMPGVHQRRRLPRLHGVARVRRAASTRSRPSSAAAPRR